MPQTMKQCSVQEALRNESLIAFDNGTAFCFGEPLITLEQNLDGTYWAFTEVNGRERLIKLNPTDTITYEEV